MLRAAVAHDYDADGNEDGGVINVDNNYNERSVSAGEANGAGPRTRMMLRSLVKKFKSHSLNEDAPPENQQQPQNTDISESQSAISAGAGDQSQVAESVQDTAPSNIYHPSPNSTVTSLAVGKEDGGLRYQPETLRQHYHTTGTNSGVANQIPRHHHLRNSAGCGCNSTTVSSIATRLRSSMAAASTTMPSMSEQQQRQQAHHRHYNSFCPHRRSSGGGTRHHCQGASSKGIGDANNAILDDEFCKDSGTESDDEELEQIETSKCLFCYVDFGKGLEYSS